MIKATETTGTTTATAMVPPAESPPPPPDSAVELGRVAVELVMGESDETVGRVSDMVGSSVDVEVMVVAEDEVGSDEDVDSVVSEEVVGLMVVSGSLVVVSLVEELEEVGSEVLVSDVVEVSESVVGSAGVDCCDDGGNVDSGSSFSSEAGVGVSLVCCSVTGFASVDAVRDGQFRNDLSSLRAISFAPGVAEVDMVTER